MHTCLLLRSSLPVPRHLQPPPLTLRRRRLRPLLRGLLLPVLLPDDWNHHDEDNQHPSITQSSRHLHPLHHNHDHQQISTLQMAISSASPLPASLLLHGRQIHRVISTKDSTVAIITAASVIRNKQNACHVGLYDRASTIQLPTFKKTPIQSHCHTVQVMRSPSWWSPLQVKP